MAETVHPNRRGLVRTPVTLVARDCESLQGVAGDPVRDFHARGAAKDWRFADPAWRDQPMYKRLAQGYLAFCDAIDRVVDDNPDWRKRERARFVDRHPHERDVADQHAGRQPGGAQAGVRDGRHEPGARHEAPGRRPDVTTTACRRRSSARTSRWARTWPRRQARWCCATRRFELLQYQPTTAKVQRDPDAASCRRRSASSTSWTLRPGRSFVEYAVAKGFQIFTMSWRNPQKEQGDWGIDDYVQSMHRRGRRRVRA